MASDTIQSIADLYSSLRGVHAVAVGGSYGRGPTDERSDVDLYVFSSGPPEIALRTAIASRFDLAPEVGNTAFGAGDEWYWEENGLALDVMYWSPDWIEEQIRSVLDRHRASVGYSTALWRTVRDLTPIADPAGWLASLQSYASRPYPEELRRNIIALNWPLVRGARSSFLHQIELAVGRGDGVSVLHRTAALVASWFDALFALNRVPHPGEKRLVEVALRECAICPQDLSRLIVAVMTAQTPPWSELAHALTNLIDSIAGEIARMGR